jgi:hypothetical protein
LLSVMVYSLSEILTKKGRASTSSARTENHQSVLDSFRSP